VATIAQRIGRDTQRPSLTGTKSFVDEIEQVLRERTPKYQAAADHAVSTDGRSVAEIVDEIIARL
jgi:shikimate kinase